MLDIEYSVITSDVIKSFDCIKDNKHLFLIHGKYLSVHELWSSNFDMDYWVMLHWEVSRNKC